MIIATAGHVDHGKTALIRALTGVDTDRLPEEKQRGMSIDLGFAYANFGGRRVGFIDVPGHQKFIRNLLAGMPGIDFALLVVAADDGVMPQTREHVAVLDLLGVTGGAVALSKIDRVDNARITEVSGQIRELLKEKSLCTAPVFPLSANSGAGIAELRAYLAAAVMEFNPRSSGGNFRLAIDRCFSLQGFGVTVTGTVFSGSAKIGDSLVLSPSGGRVRIRGIHANDQPAEQAVAGERCAINIAPSGGGALDKAAIHRGGWLLAEPAHHPTARLDARIRLLPGESGPIKHWTPVHAHIGAAHTPGRIALLQGTPLDPGGDGLVQLVLDRPTGAVRGDKIILRDASAQRTIGGGQVIDPFAPGRGRARPARLAFLRALEKPSAHDALSELLEFSAGGVALDDFARAFNLTSPEAAALWDSSQMLRFGRGADLTAISASHYAALLRRIPELLAKWHRQHPQILGPDAPELLRLLQPICNAALLHGALRQLCSDASISRAGALWHLPGQCVRPTPQDAKQWIEISPLFDAAGLTAPRIRELALSAGKPAETIEALLTRLSRAGVVTRVCDNRFFTPDMLRRLAGVTEQAAASSESGHFTAAEYRTRSGIGRNLTIEVLEYFDRVGLTRRLREGRIIRASVQDIFGA